MKSSVVIGANWGDEGKGLMTDYLCRLHKADLVVRFNGGAQAGHTVVTPKGKRHIFSHVGSGYFAGVPTYLSEYFILNPIIFKKECEDLKISDGYKIYISPACRVTTYWDMLANRCLEQMRGNKAHGSCGCGINETIERDRNFTDLSARTWAAESAEKMEIYLTEITKFWMNQLLDAKRMYDIEDLPDWTMDAFARNEEINRQFIEDAYSMLSIVKIVNDSNNFWDNFNYAVFEGAQGLGLDQFYGNYPHVTRSNTGIRNVIELQRNGNYRGGTNFDIDEIIYVSRTYETRHGNDPFFSVHGKMPEKVQDLTNVPNEWQGAMQFKELVYTNLGRRIMLDIAANNLHSYGGQKKIKLAFTHTDQKTISHGKIFYHVGRETNGMISEITYRSFGETYKDVKKYSGRGLWERLL
jgi:adenylosuccinate synthase